jgi:hypothetical protein
VKLKQIVLLILVSGASSLLPWTASASLVGPAIAQSVRAHQGEDATLALAGCTLQGGQSTWVFLAPGGLVSLVDDWSVKFRAYTNIANVRRLTPANGSRYSWSGKPAPSSWADVFHANPAGLGLQLVSGADLGETTKTLAVTKSYAVVTIDGQSKPQRITYANICLAEEHWEK